MLEIAGATLHNLRKVNARVPRGRLTVVTGVSGSGKSSLARDVLLSNMQRLLARPSRAERARNVQGAFRVPPDAGIEVAGRRLVLVDDVLTTGATLEACTRALMRSGATAVDVLVFARVVAPARLPI